MLARLDPVNSRDHAHDGASASSKPRGAISRRSKCASPRRERNLERNEALVKQQLISQTALDTSKAEVNALAARLEASQAQVKVAESGARDAPDRLRRPEVRAPFDGVVISKDAQPGEMISPMSAGGGFTRTGIATIVDMDSREIEVDVNEAYINRVKTEPARRSDARCLSGRAARGARHQHRAHRRSHQGDGARAHRVRQARSAHPAGHGHQGALPRRSAGAGGATPGPRIRVPAAAVQREGDNAYVWVVSDGRVERRAVTVGRRERRHRSKCSRASTSGDELVSPVVQGLEDGGKVKLKAS